jgi:hypothetical protein
MLFDRPAIYSLTGQLCTAASLQQFVIKCHFAKRHYKSFAQPQGSNCLLLFNSKYR